MPDTARRIAAKIPGITQQRSPAGAGAARPALAPCKAFEVTRTRTPHRMLRVMLVDDSQQEVSLLKEGLQAAGYDVVTCRRRRRSRCPTRVAALQPDVIIIDTESPTRDVLEHVVVSSARAHRGRSCCSPRTATTRRSRPR